MAGRPRLLTPLLVDRAADLRRDGHSVASALAVSKRTTLRALAVGRDDPPRVKAVTATPPLEVATEAQLAAGIARAATADWRAAAWLLERIAPERWDRARREADPSPLPVGAWAEVDELASRRRER